MNAASNNAERPSRYRTAKIIFVLNIVGVPTLEDERDRLNQAIAALKGNVRDREDQRGAER
jgi:hypothetical protein